MEAEEALACLLTFLIVLCSSPGSIAVNLKICQLSSYIASYSVNKPHPSMGLSYHLFWWARLGPSLFQQLLLATAGDDEETMDQVIIIAITQLLAVCTVHYPSTLHAMRASRMLDSVRMLEYCFLIVSHAMHRGSVLSKHKGEKTMSVLWMFAHVQWFYCGISLCAAFHRSSMAYKVRGCAANNQLLHCMETRRTCTRHMYRSCD